MQFSKIYFSISESPCANDECSRITKTFCESATLRKFEITDSRDSANYFFELFYKYKPGNRAGNLFPVEIISEIKILDKKQNTLQIKKISSIIGVGKTINEAKEKAFQEYLTSLKRRYFEQGFNKLF